MAAAGHAAEPDVAQALKRVQRLAREGLSAFRELERVTGSDLIGRFHLAAGDEVDDDLRDWLSLVVADSPGRDLTIIVVAAEPQGG